MDMDIKNCFRDKSGLQRKSVASFLAVVFSAGMFSIYAGAMQVSLQQSQKLSTDLINNKTKHKIDTDTLKIKDPDASIYNYNCGRACDNAILCELQGKWKMISNIFPDDDEIKKVVMEEYNLNEEKWELLLKQKIGNISVKNFLSRPNFAFISLRDCNFGCNDKLFCSNIEDRIYYLIEEGNNDYKNNFMKRIYEKLFSLGGFNELANFIASKSVKILMSQQKYPNFLGNEKPEEVLYGYEFGKDDEHLEYIEKNWEDDIIKKFPTDEQCLDYFKKKYKFNAHEWGKFLNKKVGNICIKSLLSRKNAVFCSIKLQLSDELNEYQRVDYSLDEILEQLCMEQLCTTLSLDYIAATIKFGKFTQDEYDFLEKAYSEYDSLNESLPNDEAIKKIFKERPIGTPVEIPERKVFVTGFLLELYKTRLLLENLVHMGEKSKYTPEEVLEYFINNESKEDLNERIVDFLEKYYKTDVQSFKLSKMNQDFLKTSQISNITANRFRVIALYIVSSLIAVGLTGVIVYFCSQNKEQKTSSENYSGNVGSGENVQADMNQDQGNSQLPDSSKEAPKTLDMKSKIIVGGVLGSTALSAGVVTGAKVITDRNKIEKIKTKGQDNDQDNSDFVYVDPAKEKVISSESLNANNGTENPKKNK